MQELDDIALLRRFAANRSEAAFNQLVSRYAGLVHSAALRQVRDPQWAAEITQAVFLILAQKAARISDRTILTGWLFKTTRYVALAQVRAEVKRRRHEQETQMQTRLESEPSSGAGDQAWAELAPLLDQALAQLNETDRQAVLLRFFESKSLAELGDKLGANEDTARKRVSRALEKLRKFFAKHRVFYSTAIIAGAISANAVQPAPAGVVAAIPAMALKGSAISISTLALVKDALRLMTIAKLKTAALLAVAALLAAGGVVVVNKLVAQENQTPRQQTAQLAPLQTGNQLASNAAVQTGVQTPLSEQEVHELARLRDEAGRLRQQINDMAKAQSGSNLPAMDESLWLIRSTKELESLPPTLILRPTHFAHPSEMFGGGQGIYEGIARDISFSHLMAMAFDRGVGIHAAAVVGRGIHAADNKIVLPPGAPTGGFDLLMTGPAETKAKLKAEIKRQLGYVAHFEPRPADVLLLTLRQAGASGLRPLQPLNDGESAASGGGGSAEDHRTVTIPFMVMIMQEKFEQPILDRSGLTGWYDAALPSDWSADSNAIIQALTPLGLALTPGREPIDQLIVEAENETAQSGLLPTENQPTSSVAVQAGPPSSRSAQPALELARLRAEIIKLREQFDAMAKTQSAANPPAADESVWLTEVLKEVEAIPPAFILRPTHFAHSGGTSIGNRVIARDISFAALMARAFDVDTNKMVLPPGAPTGGFDLLMTGPEAAKEKLQTEIKRQLGYVAHIETRPADVLLLTLREANAPGLQPSQPESGASAGGSGGGGPTGRSMIYHNVTTASLIKDMQPSFQQPILDRSGLTGNYDASLPFGWGFGQLLQKSDAILQALTPLGLELTPGREPLDLLIVEADSGN
jgi:uncharacterized protein (TIGR03435 family)